MNLNKTIILRTTEAQKQLVRRVANAEGVTESEAARMLIGLGLNSMKMYKPLEVVR